MREIKFRTWIGGRMAYWGFIDNCFVGLTYDNTELLSPAEMKKRSMEYIGIKDVNGIEIYEKDIIRNLDTGEQLQRIWYDTKFTRFQPHIQLVFPKKLEVIGNTYENPELLT